MKVIKSKKRCFHEIFSIKIYFLFTVNIRYLFIYFLQKSLVVSADDLYFLLIQFCSRMESLFFN